MCKSPFLFTKCGCKTTRRICWARHRYFRWVWIICAAFSFSLGLFFQRKADKWLCYQDLLDAFFFEGIAPKKKALQKRNGVFCAHDGNPQSSFYSLRGTPMPRRRPLLKKRCKTFLSRPVRANIVRDKSQFIICNLLYTNLYLITIFTRLFA